MYYCAVVNNNWDSHNPSTAVYGEEDDAQTAIEAILSCTAEQHPIIIIKCISAEEDLWNRYNLGLNINLRNHQATLYRITGDNPPTVSRTCCCCMACGRDER